ncbi:MAG: flagellar protein FlaG [Symbiobacteriaceae bacterium]|nr:flagellar protein FlaG [Symbiobacteriaceae bacterium]
MRIDVLSAAPVVAATQAVQAQQQAQAQAATEAIAVEELTPTTAVQPLRNNVPIENIKTAVEDTDPFFTAEDIEKLVRRGNTLFEDLHLNEQFRLVQHEKLPRTMIRLIDVQQDRVIREFPPKKYLDLVAALQELSGLLFDERV